jgi:hypothetical protein
MRMQNHPGGGGSHHPTPTISAAIRSEKRVIPAKQ